MITLVEVPPVVQPRVWNVVFNRRPARWWHRLLILGQFQHVRAYAYVPGFHAWVFYDPHMTATDIFLASDQAAATVLAAWIEPGDRVIAAQINPAACRFFPLAYWCVPAIKHLLGLRCGALRPDALWRHLLRSGGVPFEANDGSADLSAAAARPGICRARGAIEAG